MTHWLDKAQGSAKGETSLMEEEMRQGEGTNFYLKFIVMGSAQKEGGESGEHARDTGTRCHGQGHIFCCGKEEEKTRAGAGVEEGRGRHYGCIPPPPGSTSYSLAPLLYPGPLRFSCSASGPSGSF